MPKTPRPFGTWPSVLSATAVAAGKVSRSGLQVDGAWIYWLESRPNDGGRQVLVRGSQGSPPVDVSPPTRSIRTRVHEYGGGAATVSDGTLYFVDQSDQRLYRWSLDAGSNGTSTGTPTPVPLTPAPGDNGSARYADGRLSADRRWFVCVEERHSELGVKHGITAVDAHGSLSVVPLVGGRDFYAAPRLSPDGAFLAWLCWDHPQMSWDGCELWVGRFEDDGGGGTPRVTEPRRIAGSSEISVGQPTWDDGNLLYVSDEGGWWQPYGTEPGNDGAGEALARVPAEFHGPDWVLGQTTMATFPGGVLVCRMRRDGIDRLVRIGPADEQFAGGLQELEQPCVSISAVCTAPDGGVVLLGATPDVGPSVFLVALRPQATTPAQMLSALSAPTMPPETIATAQPVVATSSLGPIFGLFYPPTTATSCGPAGSLPPLVVFCHGGPTAGVDPGFDPLVQYFASRGLAVVAVDYRGSTGYGRSYRQQLRGLWGEVDIDDCVTMAVSLADGGLVDGDRMVIRGTSAGGLTALGALIRSDRFAGAAAWYGVTDLEALAAETHDFESRYLDGLVGALPQAAPTYRERSPVHHADRVTGSVLLLQGLDDPVVPVAQAERFADALRQQGVRCEYRVFPGESHGFRRAETLEACLDAELGFYGSVLGFDPHVNPEGPTTG